MMSSWLPPDASTSWAADAAIALALLMTSSGRALPGERRDREERGQRADCDNPERDARPILMPFVPRARFPSVLTPRTLRRLGGLHLDHRRGNGLDRRVDRTEAARRLVADQLDDLEQLRDRSDQGLGRLAQAVQIRRILARGCRANEHGEIETACAFRGFGTGPGRV